MSLSNNLQQEVSDDELGPTDEDSYVLTNENEVYSDRGDISTIPIWINNTAGLKKIPFTGQNCFCTQIPGEKKPDDFSLLFDDIFLEEVCKYTNAYAMEVFCSPKTVPGSRVCAFKDLTVPELKTYWELLQMGLIRL